MTPTELFQDLGLREFILEPDGNQLRVKPKSELTESDRQAIRDYKLELLELLQPSQQIKDVKVQEGKMPKAPSYFIDWQGKPVREAVAEQIRPNHCPNRCGPMNLQDQKLDAWFCPFCREWVIGV